MHPKVVEKYVQNNAEDLIVESANDANERVFLSEVKGNIKKEIVKIVRVKKGGQEYFYWHEELKGRDYLGNKRHHYRVQGKYDDPEFDKRVDARTGKPMVAEVESTETVYEHTWPNGWTPELEDIVTETVDLVVITAGRKYGGFTLQDFKDRTFEELVTIGKYGTLSATGIEREKKRQARQQHAL